MDREFYVQSDNGAEFAKYFEDACKQLGIKHYYSKLRTPKGRNGIFRDEKREKSGGESVTNVANLYKNLTNRIIWYN